MFKEGNGIGPEEIGKLTSIEAINKAELEIELSKNIALHPEIIGNDGSGKKAQKRKDRPESLEDLKAKIEIALFANPKSEKEQKVFYQNFATALAIESAQRSEAKT